MIKCGKCGGQVYPEWDKHTHKDIQVCIQCGYCTEDEESLPFVREYSPSFTATINHVDIPRLR